MEKLTTLDGSVTYYNDAVGDFYHSKSGAAEEAFEKYAVPCKIAELAKKGKVRILDVCYGLGYNTAAAIDKALEANPQADVEAVGLEKDPEIIKTAEAVEPVFKCYPMIVKASKTLSYQDNNVKIQVIVGDARMMVNTIEGDFDAVFFDPFSPSKVPDMWTKEFLEDVYHVMKKGAILATYSCARFVRDNLRAAGFEVKDGPPVGRRSPSTLAIKQ